MIDTLDSPRGVPPSSGPPVATGTIEPEAAVPFWASIIGVLAIVGVFVLAFSATAAPGPADMITLRTLGVFVALLAWTKPGRKVLSQRDGAAFTLCAVLFVVYGLSRRIVPVTEDPPQFLEENLRISYAAWVVLAGAVLSAPAWLKAFGEWARAALTSLAVLIAIGLCSFFFIGKFYPPGSANPMIPGYLVQLLQQSVEYGALLLCCNAVAAHPRLRIVIPALLPFLIWALWAKHHLAPPPVAEEDE